MLFQRLRMAEKGALLAAKGKRLTGVSGMPPRRGHLSPPLLGQGGLSIMKSVALGLALAAVGMATAAHASLSVIPIASPGNWSAFDNVNVGSTFGMTMTNAGMISFTTDGNVAVGTNPNVDAAPAGDSSHYVWGVGGVTVTFANPVTSFDIYWGSIDGSSSNNNVLTIGSDSITGAYLVSQGYADGGGDQSGSIDNRWFQISSTTPFTTFTASSTTNAFEFDMSGSAPEASTWAMMLMGFAGLGYAALRRGRNASPAAVA